MNVPLLNLILALGICAVTFFVCISRNVATAFAICFIPVMLLLRPVAPVIFNGGLPELRMSNAAIVGLMGGMLLRLGQQMKIRWSWVDAIFLLAPAVAITSAIQTENWHTGYNELLKQLFAWLVPYFVARYSFRSDAFRKNCLWAMIFVTLFLAVFAAIEFRLWPHFYDQRLQSTGLKVGYNVLFLQRGAFFRAETSFEHPIFFGDGCVSLFCMILMLAATLKGGWTRPIVLVSATAALFGLVTSISFGPYLALGIAGGTYVVLRYVSLSRYVWGFFVSFAVLVMVGLTAYLAYHPVPERTKKEGVGDSFLVRWEIVQKCWPLAEEAGPLGNGKPKIMEVDSKGKPLLELESVDNAYMLFYVVRGFLYAGLWAAIPICVSFRVAKAMRRTKQKEFLFPLAIGAGSSIGISFAFYFVWAGWNPEPYTMLWLIATAFTMSLCDACFEGIEAQAALPNLARKQWQHVGLPIAASSILSPMPLAFRCES